jgi:hypothetical protein
MADALNRLRESTTSLAGAAATLGAPTPTDPLSAQAMGASPNAAQMAGTPANKLAALRDSAKEENTQGLDQKQEDHTKETLLSKRMKDDAILAGTTGKLTDRLALLNQEKIKASITVTPIENLLPADIKADPAMKGAISAFLKPDATAQERDAAIRAVINKSKDPEMKAKLSYDTLSSVSSITGLTIMMKALGVKDATEDSISASIIASFPPDQPISQTLTPSNASNWEAVFGPGASPTALQDFLTATGANPNDNWASLGPKLKEWQQNKQQDWATLQEQARSTNNAVRTDAQNKLRELGYLGAESSLEKIQTVTQSVINGGQFKLGETTFDTAALRAGDVTQKENLKNLLTQATLGTLTDKTLEAQLKELMKSGTLAGLIDAQDVAPIEQIRQVHEANMALFNGLNPNDPSNVPVNKDLAKQYLEPALFEALTTATRSVSETELPAWMNVVRKGGTAGNNLTQVMNGAGRYPELQEAIKTMGPHMLTASQLTTKPQTVLANFAGKDAIKNALTSVQAGNIGAIDTLGAALVGNVVQFNNIKNLPAPYGIQGTTAQGVSWTGDIAALAQNYLDRTNVMGLIVNPEIQVGLQNEVKKIASVANNTATSASDYINYHHNVWSTNTKELEGIRVQVPKLQAVLAPQITEYHRLRGVVADWTNRARLYPSSSNRDALATFQSQLDKSAALMGTTQNQIAAEIERSYKVKEALDSAYKTMNDAKAQYAPFFTPENGGRVTARNF